MPCFYFLLTFSVSMDWGDETRKQTWGQTGSHFLQHTLQWINIKCCSDHFCIIHLASSTLFKVVFRKYVYVPETSLKAKVCMQLKYSFYTFFTSAFYNVFMFHAVPYLNCVFFSSSAQHREGGCMRNVCLWWSYVSAHKMCANCIRVINYSI